MKRRRYKTHCFFVLVAVFQFAMIVGQADLSGAQEAVEFLISGDKAFAEGKYDDAEMLFKKAVDMEPDNYKSLRALADTKVKLQKYVEAVDLLDRILKKPTAAGRDILVTIPGDPEAQAAELVDENVMVLDESDEGAGTANKFLKSAPPTPVPHYRVYLKKIGKMKLLPKSKTRIQYHGIPTATREQVTALKMNVQKKIISSTAQEKPEEEMQVIAGGCFQMGSMQGDPDEQPTHEVCLSPYRIDKYEVRQKYFQAIMGVNPSQNVGPDLPVDSVAWDQARDYCRKQGLRLPSEAQWEFAARGGTHTEFYWGNTLTGKEGNFCDSVCELNIREPGLTDGFKHTAVVGSFPPNPYGLYDMAGNLSEWVQDWMDAGYYRASPKKDPQGARPDLDACATDVDCAGSFSITQKVYRGGAWNQKAGEMRSANRRDSHFQLRAEGIGFRCAASGGGDGQKP